MKNNTMPTILRWIYRSRRKWRKFVIYGMLAVGIVCFIFYAYLHVLFGKSDVGLPINGFIQQYVNVTPSRDMKKKIQEIKKNIVDIEYFGKNDEQPSKESFLGILSEQSFVYNSKNDNNSNVGIDYSEGLTESPVLVLPSKKTKKPDFTIFKSNHQFRNAGNSDRYLYILGHYEQLGKTVVNFMHASILAAQMKRKLILPFVRNSRFCGLNIGWTGSHRQKSREFLPMDNYFDVDSVEKIFRENKFSELAHFEEYRAKCKSSVMLYFIYDGERASTMRYFRFSESEYTNLENILELTPGVIDCTHIEDKVKSGDRISDVSFDKGFCIDAERVTKIEQMPKAIRDANCLTVFLWRGVGPQRTRFNVTFPVSGYDHYLSQIKFSHSILSEARDFTRFNLMNEPYIGIQIRSERQLSWYGLAKFKHCLDLVVKVASLFVYKKKIKRIFVASDLEKHGSDQLVSILNATVLAKAKSYFETTFKKLEVSLYRANKRRGLIHNDSGYVALTQMEILSRSSHLITLGAGTFQDWVKARFKKNKANVEDSNSWSITRVCSVESKRWRSSKKRKGSFYKL